MKTFLVGKRISLHGLNEADIEVTAPYYSWLDDLELDEFAERSRFANNPEKFRAYVQHARSNSDLILLGIYDNGTDRHIGNISLKSINWQNRSGWLGYLIGESEFRNRGLATEAVLMFVYYCFNKLNLRRIYTTVNEKNLASVRILEKVGFVKEGCLRQSILNGDTTADCFAYGVLAHEWMVSHSQSAKECYEHVWF